MTLGGVAVLSTRRMSQRNIVSKVAESQALVQNGAVPSTANSIGVGGPSIPPRIPEGDEDAGDDALVGSSSSLLGRNSATGADRNGVVEVEMDELGASKRAAVASTLPILKSSAALSNFSDRAAEEQKELADLAGTIESTTTDLAAKLAQAGYGTPQQNNIQDEPPLLHPTAPVTISPALAIQIEADQAYLQRQDDKSGISGVPVSQAGRKYKQNLISRYETDMEILRLSGGVALDGSPRLTGRSATPIDLMMSPPTANANNASGPPSRPQTPRSAYVQVRERAASISSSGRNSPVSVTPVLSARRLGEESPESPSPRPTHMRSLSISGSSALTTPHVRPVPPSAIFSGAFLESAQDLPDVDNDTRLQRLTRLSTVGHWVAGLHAQMPVAGGVVQAILQAKEMQAAIAAEDAEEKPPTATSPPVTPNIKPDQVALDIITGSEGATGDAASHPHSDASGAGVGAGAHVTSSVPSSSSSSSVDRASMHLQSAAVHSHSHATPAPAAAAAAAAHASDASATDRIHATPVTRVIKFDDDYVTTHTHTHTLRCESACEPPDRRLLVALLCFVSFSSSGSLFYSA